MRYVAFLWLGVGGCNLGAAAEIRLRAERKAGELLRKMEKRNGARDGKRATTMGVRLSDLGLTHNQSSRWQLIATVKEADFAKIIAECNETDTTPCSTA
jgi:hypothetical protein